MDNKAYHLLLHFVLQIGRRIFRQRLETGDREADAEQRRVGYFSICY